MGGRGTGAAPVRLAELEATSTGAQGVARLDGSALHEDFAVTQEVVIHHVRSHHGDDDPVVADDARRAASAKVSWCATGP